MLNSQATTRQRAIETARAVIAQRPVYLDTETTGLERSDEIVEISIIDDDGQVVFESLVKPSKPIPASATSLHGITNADVQKARPWPIVWPQARAALTQQIVVIYNAEFDVRMIQQSYTQYKLPWKDKVNAFDLLKLYSEFRGEWDSARRAYRYHSLAKAGEHCGISLPNAHRATADTLLARALLHYIADFQG